MYLKYTRDDRCGTAEKLAMCVLLPPVYLSLPKRNVFLDEVVYCNGYSIDLDLLWNAK